MVTVSKSDRAISLLSAWSVEMMALACPCSGGLDSEIKLVTFFSPDIRQGRVKTLKRTEGENTAWTEQVRSTLIMVTAEGYSK